METTTINQQERISPKLYVEAFLEGRYMFAIGVDQDKSFRIRGNQSWTGKGFKTFKEAKVAGCKKFRVADPRLLNLNYVTSLGRNS